MTEKTAVEKVQQEYSDPDSEYDEDTLAKAIELVETAERADRTGAQGLVPVSLTAHEIVSGLVLWLVFPLYAGIVAALVASGSKDIAEDKVAKIGIAVCAWLIGAFLTGLAALGIADLLGILP